MLLYQAQFPAKQFSATVSTSANQTKHTKKYNTQVKNSKVMSNFCERKFD